MENNNNIQFGYINTETGEFKEGYIENGEMKYREPTLWEKITGFFKSGNPVMVETDMEEYAGTTILTLTNLFGKSKFIEVPVYRIYNKYTNKTVKLYSKHREYIIIYDSKAYDVTGKIFYLKHY